MNKTNEKKKNISSCTTHQIESSVTVFFHSKVIFDYVFRLFFAHCQTYDIVDMNGIVYLLLKHFIQHTLTCNVLIPFAGFYRTHAFYLSDIFVVVVARNYTIASKSTIKIK